MTPPALKQLTYTLDTPTGVLFSAGEARIFPSIGLAAMKNREGSYGGAYRAWQLARIFDSAGSGAVDLADFKAWAEVNPRTLRDWIADAVEMRLFVVVSFGTRVMLASTASAAAILGCPRVDNFKVKVGIAALAGKDWKALILAALESPFSPHPGHRDPLSRKEIYRATSIPPRTQRRYEQKAGVKTRRNFAKSADKDELAGATKFRARVGAHVWHDPKTKEDEARFRLPDDRDTSKAAVRVGRGRSRKVNQALKALGCSDCTRPADVARGVRLFNNDLAEFDRSMKGLGDMRYDARPAELYLRVASESRSYGLWQQFPLGDGWRQVADNSFCTTGGRQRQHDG